MIDLGHTQVSLSVFNEFLREISPNFTPAKYSLLKWNCNNFSDEVCKFLLQVCLRFICCIVVVFHTRNVCVSS